MTATHGIITVRNSGRVAATHCQRKDGTHRVRNLLSVHALPTGAAVTCFVVYVLTLAPTVTSEDSGELIAAAYCFGVPHPPGYPLWTFLCGLFIKVLPLGAIAWRANLFSATVGALAVAVLCRCFLMLGVPRPAALGAALAVGFGAVLWSQTVITEVYSLHALMFSLLLWSVLKWHVTKQRVWLVVGAGLLGLGMCNHHTLALSAVGLAVWVALLKTKLLADWRLALLCFLVFVVGLTPYAYLLARARAKPSMNWGDPSTLRTLIHHVNRGQYKRASLRNNLRPQRPPREYLRQARVVGTYCANEHTPYLAAVSVVGLGALSARRRHLALLFILLTVAHAGLFLKFQGIGESRSGIWSSKVFFVSQYMLMGIPLAFGLSFLCKLLETLSTYIWRLQATYTRKAVTSLAACSAPLLPLISNWDDNNYRRYWFAYDHAINILASSRPNALIIPSGDHNTFPLIYVHQVEGMRPDIVVADKYGYIEPDLYGEMPGYHGRRPHSRIERDEIEEWLIRTAKRPVYYTVKKESLVPNVKMVPVGILYHLLPDGKSLDPAEVWPSIRYRNLVNGRSTSQDYGADNILSDYEFFFALHELQQGHEERALDHFAQAAEYGRGIKEVFNNIGCALAEHGLVDDAIGYYQRACQTDRRYASGRWNLARLYKSISEWTRAEGVFLELAEATPGDFRVFGELGFLGTRNGVPMKEIQRRFEESLRLNPSQPQIIRELASYYDNGPEVALALDAKQGVSAPDKNVRAGLPQPGRDEDTSRPADEGETPGVLEPPNEEFHRN